MSLLTNVKAINYTLIDLQFKKIPQSKQWFNLNLKSLDITRSAYTIIIIMLL